MLPSIKDHFIIFDSQIKDDFQKIRDNWTDINNKANPISSLFIEIICNRSTRINSFLNLAQALEVYSSNYHKKEAKKDFSKR